MENGIQPVMPVGNMGYGYGDGWGGGAGCFMWIILLFALMGGNGWNNRDTNVARIQDVYASNDNQTLNANVRDLSDKMFRLGNGISDATFALNNSITNIGRDIANGTYVIDKAVTDTRYVLGNAINDGRFATQYGFAEMGRNIDGVRYDGAMNTCKITTNATENTQKILDKLNNMEFNAMKAENENLRMALAKEHNINVNYAQTRDIVGAVRPFPVPTFLVGNPYGNGSCNCGVNYGCQC